jgi:SAM-dependent methyltransferase
MRVDYFDEPVAHRYDAESAAMFDPSVVAPVVDVLAELAGNNAALEFGVGTGRIAIPLAARGVRVHGIDLSAAMLAQLHAKPEARGITTTAGDITDVRVPGQFSVVYLVFNTIMNLTTQDDQVACFANAARHLSPGGWFVIDVMVPELQRLPAGETIRPFAVGPTRLGFDEYDVVEQQLVSHHYWFDNGAGRTLAMPFRYVWPSELDLMARLAGLQRRHRWGGWDRSPFTAASAAHVSVWQKGDPAESR